VSRETVVVRGTASIGNPLIESLGPVVVVVPARPGFVHVLRTVVASVAARFELSIDEVEEMRIAVDEAAALLLHLHAPVTTLRAELTANGTGFTIRLSSDVAVSDWPPPGTEEAWPWRVITGLCDEAGFDVSPTGPEVWMRRRRSDRRA
jgi:serine/threonine-protein kinase RsbW